MYFGKFIGNNAKHRNFSLVPSTKHEFSKRNNCLKGKQEVQWLNSGERRLPGGKMELEKINGGADQ
jgi:hypothetical protein